MAAGLGFKDFTTGEVLTAADVDGYLMQGVWVFASAAARDAAVTSPQEGNFAYLKDTNTTTYYTGSAWTNLDTTGMVNPMTTTGDTIYSSSGSTPARLGIGSTGQVLTVSGGVPSWATPAGGGGMTLLATTTLSGSSVTVSGLSTSYKNLLIVWNKAYASTNCDFSVRYNSDTGTNYYNGLVQYNTYEFNAYPNNDSSKFGSLSTNNSDKESANGYAQIFRYAEGDSKFIFSNNFQKYGASLMFPQTNFCNYDSSTAISSLTFIVNTGTFSGGTVYTYGVS